MDGRETAIKRRTYLVNRRLQLRYAGFILLLVMGVSVVSGYTIFYTLWSMLGDKLARVYPQGMLEQILRRTTFVLTINLLVVAPFIVWISILYSHRIAGPLVRITRALKEIGEGNFDTNITLRKRDELKELAASINGMAASLKKLKEQGFFTKAS